MDRKEFLSLVGLGAGALVMGCSLVGCKKDESTAPTPVDFTLDLTLAENTGLNINGGSRVVNGVLIAKSLSGNYIAVSSSCTHEGTTVNFDSGNNRFHCPNHGSNFNLNGSVSNGPAGRSLTQYKTTLTGTSLKINS